LFLHLGKDVIIRAKDIVAILNGDKFPFALIPVAPEDYSVGTLAQAIMGIFVTDKAVYLTPISPSTLKKRVESGVTSNNHEGNTKL